MRLPIRWRLVLYIAIPLLMIYVGVMGWVMVRVKAYGRAELESWATERAQHYASRVEGRLLESSRLVAADAAYLADGPSPDEEWLRAWMESNLRIDPLIHRSCIVVTTLSPPGCSRICVKRGVPGLEQGASNCPPDYLASFRAGWSEPFAEKGLPLVRYAHPSAAPEGGGPGLAWVDLSLEGLDDWLDSLGLLSGQFYLITREGNLVARPEEEWLIEGNLLDLARREGWTPLEDLLEKAMAGQTGTGNMPGPAEGEFIWASYAPLRAMDWSLGVVVEERKAMDFLYRQVLRAIGGMGLALALAIGSIWLASKHLARPITRLAEAVRHLGAGNLDVRVPEKTTRDEIADLGDAFNRMVGDLREQIDARAREAAAREAVEGELRVAREIQNSLLPRTFPPFPDREEFDLHAVNLAARRVAGDFFDFFFLDGHRLVMVIADVAGKGVPAALFMAVARTILRNLWAHHEDPGRILAKANDALYQDNPGALFVTMFAAAYDTRTGLLRYANAGHPPPYLVEAGGTVRSFGPATGLVLGVRTGEEYGEGEEVLDPGDSLVLYTDGIPEARSPEGEFYGDERLARFLEGNAGLSPGEMCGALMNEAQGFQEEDQDDLTVLVLRRNR